MRTLFDNVEAVAVPAPPAVRAIAPMVRVTEAYDAWWRFAYERQQIYYRRLRGEAAPWTDDLTLSRYRFTNAYRVADRVSQYLIKEVIYPDDLPQDANEVVFRILLFKFFNRIETWETLTSQLGSVALADNPFARIDEILSGELAAERRIYSAAYIMPTGRSRKISARKHQTHLALLREMMADCLGDRLADAPTMKAGFDLLRSYPMIGDFLGYQFIIDVNYSDIVDFSETEFVAAGPGAREGLRKCFADAGGRSDSDLIRMMMDMQEDEFARLGLDFHDLFGRPLKLIDCQNLFCEVAKYARARFPALTPPGGRARIKQKYRPAGRIAAPFFPPKWGMNDAVIALFPPSAECQPPDLDRYQAQAGRTSFHTPVPGGDAITTPILGLIGETGEVASELKKRAREGTAYVAFPDRLGEELGDLLWYISDLAERCGIRLADLDHVDASGSEDDMTCVDDGEWIRVALSLAEQVGRISSAYEGLLAGRISNRKFNCELSMTLASLMTDLRMITRLHGLSLANVAEDNLVKINHRWVLPKDSWASSERGGVAGVGAIANLLRCFAHRSRGPREHIVLGWRPDNPGRRRFAHRQRVRRGRLPIPRCLPLRLRRGTRLVARNAEASSTQAQERPASGRSRGRRSSGGHRRGHFGIGVRLRGSASNVSRRKDDRRLPPADNSRHDQTSGSERTHRGRVAGRDHSGIRCVEKDGRCRRRPRPC